MNKTQLVAVQAAAKELRKVYSKKISENLCNLMRVTLKQLSKHFQVRFDESSLCQAAAVESSLDDQVRDDEPLYEPGEIIFILETYLRCLP